jgi:hypothetical protein
VTVGGACRWLLFLVACTSSTASAWSAEAAVLRVGPERALKTLAEAARAAAAGTVIEVDAGTYRGDVAVWTQPDLELRAVGGRVRLLADGRAAEGKAIWVVRAQRMRVEGFDFEGAAVPSRNGAGIRFESGSLKLRDCSFKHNEMGLLTGNDPSAVLDIENSEFAHNRRADGHNHQLYVGTIARLTLTGSYLHHGYVGHLLKSRAAVNLIHYNRLTDETDGRASYEIEFPNGGAASVVGNIVQQSAFTENQDLIAYGAEGYRWRSNTLLLSHNTLVDQRPSGGVFLRIHPGEPVQVRAVNNLLVGAGAFDPGDGDVRNNLRVAPEAFENPAQGDYRLARDIAARAIDTGDDAARPRAEYRHPAATRPLARAPGLPGAQQSRR